MSAFKSKNLFPVRLRLAMEAANVAFINGKKTRRQLTENEAFLYKFRELVSIVKKIDPAGNMVYSEVVQKLLQGDYRAHFPPGADPFSRLSKNSLSMFLNSCFQIARYETLGEHAYRLHENLAEALLYTKIKGLTMRDVQMPFQSIYIEMPPRYEALKRLFFETCFDVRDQEGLVEGIYVTVSDEIDCQGRECRAVSLWIITAPLIENHKDDTAFVTTSMSTFSYHGLIPYLCDEEIVKHRYQTEDDRRMRSIYNFVLNVIVYATNTDPGVLCSDDPKTQKLQEYLARTEENSSHRRKLERQINKRGNMHHYLGADRVIYKSLRQNDGCQNQAQSRARGHSGYRLRHSVMVSGHWRRQPYGEGRLQRRQTWIEPFWRGPRPTGETQAAQHYLH